MSRTDPQSYFDDDQPQPKHLHLRLNVDFAHHQLDGEVHHNFSEPISGPLDFDTKGLTIHAVENEVGRRVPFEVGSAEPILGSRLRLMPPTGTRQLRIAYTTSPDAAALQWLTPEQTKGEQPFLYSQCQAINARSMVPLQDSPGVRISYTAQVTVPSGLVALMSAGSQSQSAASDGLTATFQFKMPRAIPSYLIALAVGDLVSKDLSPRSRVWAEPKKVAQAAWEFAGIEEMITRAEALFGPYEWQRFDVLVLPASFPYGGMENPCMTFLTPTLLAGDRSLVDVVTHELAHSWTGNLVTNASMEHFWLNEGFTVWAERRILEAIHGPKTAVISWAIGRHELHESLERFGADSPFTALRTHLEDMDPDDVYSSIPYEKGALFVALLEQTAGRVRFDGFIRAYMERFRFTSITTEQFLTFLETQLPGVAERVGAQQWLYEPGLPANAPVFRSPELEQLMSVASGWETGTRPTPDQIQSWTPSMMLVYLQNVPHELDGKSCAWLDSHLQLMERKNYEILVEWLTIAAGSNYEPAFERIRQVLATVGRMKYLRPLYIALGQHPRTRALAREAFAEAAPGYHSVARHMVHAILDEYQR